MNLYQLADQEIGVPVGLTSLLVHQDGAHGVTRPTLSQG
jgi:hypothetical protein